MKLGNAQVAEGIIDGWHRPFLAIDKRRSTVAVIGTNGGSNPPPAAWVADILPVHEGVVSRVAIYLKGTYVLPQSCGKITTGVHARF